ncbi:Crp/Fnr family transcriptional regulator [Coleofasciculus sp. FACHB-1120]|uniref:Crp/Fnr family transcriptional regulator n=1 Tax=Coleofasciculus sp. FACHB-1120 TaxID=2692783 RepID=UPI001682136E|nr:Crp/Fnr family transcriptional regulator [Coleofasciculus sp. FACHB-1120]MBD2742177.1 Crp/Fnr family transcriptional regulator [Coleofasciculus sp. FACHB-1120]
MTASPFLLLSAAHLKRRTFSRRSLLPLEQNYLWRIETGVVRTLTWLEDGTTITLGLWGPGDIVGRVLSKADPYQIECLTLVEAKILPVSKCQEATESMILHIQQFQEFIEILHCKSVDASLLRLLTWLAKRFGREIEQGKQIDLRLTHQEIAELIGATRVTVTRLLNEFEKRGIIQRLPHRFIVLQEQQPFWHYEI